MRSIRKTFKNKNFKDKKTENLCHCSFPYRSLLHSWTNFDSVTSSTRPKFISFFSECSKIIYVDFAVNGRYLACINVKNSIDYQDPLTTSTSLAPTSQLMLLKATHSANSRNPNEPEFSDDDCCLNAIASINLELVEVYCVEMSNDTTQIAVYGFGYNTMPRKPAISIYEIHIDKTEATSLSRKTKLIFENSEILYSKLTCCKFFPNDGNILVTAMCEDYHSIRKTSYLDFWNSKSSLHFARFDLTERAPDFQGYVTSMAFSSDGLILAMTSSSQYSQLILYSAQTHQFGPVFSQKEYKYEEQEEHFQSYCTFATNLGDYELLVCTFHGEVLRLKLDPLSLKVTYIISHTVLFDRTLQLNFQGQPFFTLGFTYCRATSRYLIKSSKGIAYVDANSNLIDKVIAYENSEQGQTTTTGSLIAVSRTGQELAFISNNCLQVYFCQNPDLSLKNCCRQKIIQLVTEDKIWQLPLPKILLSYLLYEN